MARYYRRFVVKIGGRKYYQLRDKNGRFCGLQLYARAHKQDIQRRSKDECRKRCGVNY